MGIDLNYTDSFDKEALYKLSVLIGADNLFYGLYNSSGKLVKSNKLQSLSPNDLSTQEGLKELLSSEGLSGLHVIKTIIGVDNDEFTFVPFSEYEKVNKNIYLQHITDLKSTDEVLVDFKNNVCTIYAMDSTVHSNLTGAFTNPEIVHLQTAMHNEMSAAYRNATLLNINDQGVKVYAFKNGKMLLGNNYNTTENLGVLYFTSLAYNQLDLDRDSYPLYLSGKIDKDRKAYDLLYKYIRNVDFVKPESMTKKEGSHYYYELHCLSKCA